MSRVVLPDLLALQLATLDDAVEFVGKYEQEFQDLLRERKHDTREPGTPVSLRWVTNPILGFPRAPFEVWRRVRQAEPTVPVIGTATPSAPRRLIFPDPVIEVRYTARPDPGRVLVVDAITASGRVIPGQRVLYTAETDGRLRGPGIAGLRLTGGGRIENVGALPQADVANLPDWVRIEVVGFPFEVGELPTSAYDPGAQGWEAPSMSGPDAALLRLRVAQLFQLDPPPPAGGFTTPSWPFPDPKLFLEALRNGPLDDIAQCLTATDDSDPTKLQADSFLTRFLPGLHQPGQPAGPDPAKFELATTKFIALAVNDSPVATGLGFGTLDVPEQRRYVPKDILPPGTSLSPFEYMVTAKFVLWFGITLEIAAIGHHVAAPTPFADLRADGGVSSRAATRDAPESISVGLSWVPPRTQVGAAAASRRAPSPTNVLNEPRPNNSGGFEPYLTEHRLTDDGTPSAGQRAGVTVPDETVPRSGSAVTAYAAAPIDAHGRWGQWRTTSHTATARAVQQPGLHDVSVELPAPLPSSGPMVSGATLVVEVSWDWADRSPDRIEVSGKYVAVDIDLVGPPPPTISGFQPTRGGAVGPPMVISFSPGGIPSVPGPATVAEVADPIGAGPLPATVVNEVRRYRVRVPTMSFAFGPSGELAFAVSARGAERVRPAEPSGPVAPRATTVFDPFAPFPPTLPPVHVLWTALPDAAGRARAVLTWPSSPGAAGYSVWEATEAAVFHAVSGGASPATGQTLRTRAGDLRTRIAGNQAASLASFSRINARPLTTPAIELVLPGTADTLFLYRVSAVSAQNVESARSESVVFVGVPHRDMPGTPRVEARAGPGPGEIELYVFAGASSSPASLRLHRVRRESLAAQVGTMGPPRVGPVTVAGLPAVEVPSPSGQSTPGWRFVDAVDPSWQPYFYRCVATGRNDPDDGVHAGDSPASGVVSAIVPPSVPPLLASASTVTGTAGTLLTFDTDLPFLPTPAGRGTITVASVTVAGNAAERRVLATLLSQDIAVGLPPAIDGPPVTVPVASRTATSAGTATVSLLVPPTVTGSVVVTATDPRGRSTSLEVPKES